MYPNFVWTQAFEKIFDAVTCTQGAALAFDITKKVGKKKTLTINSRTGWLDAWHFVKQGQVFIKYGHPQHIDTKSFEPLQLTILLTKWQQGR